MRCLLDTHTLLWFDSHTHKLSEKVLDTLLDERNELFVSMASIWEMQIKTQLGKLSMQTSLDELIRSQQQTNGIRLLEIMPQHIYSLNKLPYHHRDPFDRMLLSQGVCEELTILTIDSKMHKYQALVACYW